MTNNGSIRKGHVDIMNSINMKIQSQSKKSFISSFIEVSLDFLALYLILIGLWLTYFTGYAVIFGFTVFLALAWMAREIYDHHEELNKGQLIIMAAGMFIVFLYGIVSISEKLISAAHIDWDSCVAFLEIIIGILILSLTAFWILIKK